jgi:oxygen-independent coproporphyrinogen-3 oxidase
MSLGLYISVPFCRSKCTYCNFASGVFSAAQMGRYVDRVIADVRESRAVAAEHGAEIPEFAGSIYLGGGTPSLLPVEELKRLFAVLQGEFRIAPKPEITVECAPGTLTEAIIAGLVECGVNRVSLGVQSFVDQEAASVARLHTREKTLKDIANLREAGISNMNVDLIAGLPHQTRESWNESLSQAIETGVPHLSVYMLEVDEHSRLGRELIAGGTKYHAHSVPDDDLTAEFYEIACERLATAGVKQYEISNFAQPGFESHHNLRYWTREPYLGFGVDAHSMLAAAPHLRNKGVESLRFSTTDSYDEFLRSSQLQVSVVSQVEALEESFFLGLRLNRGVNLEAARSRFDKEVGKFQSAIDELIGDGLLDHEENALRLTPRGRLVSNEVFEKFVLTAPVLR